MPTTRWERTKKFFELESASTERRSNEDLDPIPPNKRTWTFMHYAVFWVSDNLSVSGFRQASSIMDVGLSWKMTLVVTAIGQTVQGLFITICGIAGANYHVPFTIQSRASFGFYLSYLFIAMRCIVAIFWYGIQAYTGAECVRTMLYAIWPSFHNVKNTIPEHENIDTQLMVAYVIYFLTCLPMHWVGVHRLRWFFLLKAITTPFVSFALMIWTVKKAGVGNTSLFTSGNTIHGSALAWQFMSSLYSTIGGGTTLMVNAPDYSRFAPKPNHTMITILTIPVTSLVMAFLGVVVASGSAVIYGSIQWDPLILMDNWTSKGGRAAAFFIAFSFYLSQLGLNIAANSIASANDMNCMFPRYINIRRGQFISAFLGAWALTPWNILTGAPAFLSFMSGYSVWLTPIAGIMISDYFFVHRGNYNVFELYNSNGIYRFNKYGCNWRSWAAFTLAWVPLLPGFLPKVSTVVTTMNVGMEHLYDVGFFYGMPVSIISYYLLCKFFPAEETMITSPVYAFVEDYSGTVTDPEQQLSETYEKNSME
ncbi:permease for cytosine/purines, uracil, thiamine, allantoin-domain-containing protein [Dipodascopsis tothii]|uniref:permease for cytosine/purines, uracil, thiamine, allantoin-domain-containing protein n=1 Tax=Dipodascopsis tothii TaxID=44089 RepID=UPI0034D01B9E